MSKRIEKILSERSLHPYSYQKVNKVYIINCREGDYVIKLDTNNFDIYKYLLSRDFLFYPENYTNKNDDYDISSYINQVAISDKQKLEDYLKVIAILHFKTSYKRVVDLDEIKSKYEDINNTLMDLRKYYTILNDEIDHELLLSPSKYLLVRNITLFYSVIDYATTLLNEVYQVIKDEKSIRVSLLHNNPDLNHFLVSDHDYLINWDKSYFDSPIYELEKIYRKYYYEISLIDLIKLYEGKNKLSLLEKKRLLVYLSIPKKIIITNNTYQDTKEIYREIIYLRKVYELLINYENVL